MAAKAPYYKVPVTAVYDWTGFYMGVNAGYGVGRDRLQNNDPITPGSATSTYLQPAGGSGGGQIGYNWQTGSMFGPLVYGVEADIQGGELKDSYPLLNNGAFPLAPQDTYSQKIDWFGTVRGRVGLATGPVLSYVTGGYAYGNVTTTYRPPWAFLPWLRAASRAAGPSAAASRHPSAATGPARSSTSISTSATRPTR